MSKEKGRAIIRSKGNIKVPAIKPLDYGLSFIHALNFYNSEVDDNKKKREFAYAYWNSIGKQTKILDSVPDPYFHTVGAVAHMAINDAPLDDDTLIRLANAHTRLCSLVPAKVQPSTAEVKPNVQERIDDVAAEHIGEIEHAIDRWLDSEEQFDTKMYLTTNEVKGAVSKRIGEWFKPRLKELSVAYDGQDKQLLEAYSYLGKRKLKRLIDFVSSIVRDCSHMEVIAKTMRVPRAKKAKPAGVLVKDVQFLREFSDLNLKSVTPDKMIGTSMIVLYNVKLRKVFVYEAMDGYEMTIKGTTIMGFDPAKSGGKICRKPETQLKGSGGWTKRPWSSFFKGIKATISKGTGRINSDCLILGCF